MVTDQGKYAVILRCVNKYVGNEHFHTCQLRAVLYINHHFTGQLWCLLSFWSDVLYDDHNSERLHYYYKHHYTDASWH